MKIKYIILMVALLAAGLTASAQKMGDLIAKPNVETRLVLPVERPAGVRKAKAEKAAEPESALYREVVRRNSWLEGLGEPLTREEAKRLPYYYRMTYKNDAGRWMHIEAMHGDTMTMAHSVDMYDLVERGDTANQWARRLGTVTQWMVYPTSDGLGVAEERAYDRDGNMIYGFQPMPLSDGRVIGTFLDDYGRLVDFRDEPDNYPGSVVRIIYDRYGRDSIVDFLDGRGYRKTNAKRVDRIRYERDSIGRIVRLTSHNPAGVIINDVTGITGFKREYVGDRTVVTTHIDKNLKPTAPSGAEADAAEAYIRRIDTLDEYGRPIYYSIEYDSMYKYGMDKMRLTYDDEGNLLERKTIRTAYGEEGAIFAPSSTAVTIETQSY